MIYGRHFERNSFPGRHKVFDTNCSLDYELGKMKDIVRLKIFVKYRLFLTLTTLSLFADE